MNSSKYEIEKAKLHDFLRRWEQGEFPGQRIGQAFYQYFHLHKMNLPREIDRDIYEATKMGVIYQYFIFK